MLRSLDSLTHYTKSGDINIAYQVHGDGPLDLVFVPGFVWHVELAWEIPALAHFLRRLAGFGRLIMFDKRGQGMSDRPMRPPTLEDSMEDVRAVLEASGSEQAAIFGISEGGPMSTLFAATFPERVVSLILFGTQARVLSAPDFPWGVDEEQLDRWQARALREWGGAAGVDLWAPSAVGDQEFESWWARLLRQGTSPAGALELINLYREIDVRPVLPSVRVPTLVLHRTGDRLVSVEQARYLARTIPDARLLELPGGDHLPFIGDQDRLLDEAEEFLTGSRRAHEPERALATVLFTDIVGSTETAAAVGDKRWREMLERHDSTIRRTLEIHRGREVKTMGDGFLATFDGPARAIRCADAIRTALSSIGVDVRVGIHTGEVELIGEDVGGMAVNIGARIGAIAAAGEILVSSTVRELVVGSGLTFTERGAHTLKGVPGEWVLFALD
jgi:class 3 adenylate cyclase